MSSARANNFVLGDMDTYIPSNLEPNHSFWFCFNFSAFTFTFQSELFGSLFRRES